MIHHASYRDVIEALTLGTCYPQASPIGTGAVYDFPCGLAVASEVAESTAAPTLYDTLRAAHENHHLLGHPPHGRRWPLVSEVTPDGVVVSCPGDPTYLGE